MNKKVIYKYYLCYCNVQLLIINKYRIHLLVLKYLHCYYLLLYKSNIIDYYLIVLHYSFRYNFFHFHITIHYTDRYSSLYYTRKFNILSRISFLKFKGINITLGTFHKYRKYILNSSIRNYERGSITTLSIVKLKVYNIIVLFIHHLLF